MSAIFGIFYSDNKPVKPRALAEMDNILSHRGPDGNGVWLGTSIGFGHRFLRTTIEARKENLPRESDDKSFVITSDARLDNRKEIINLLGEIGQDDSSISDSELILEAYKRWGEACPEQLLGDFTFAIWDARRQKIFCARDHFGVKPLYYYADENFFAFATEIKALLLLPEVPRRINEQRLADYLAGPFQDKKLTMFEGILRLEPGHCLVVTKNGVKVSSYWNLKLPPELKLKSDNEYAEALRERFTEAVECRLRSSVPIGAMLSGGIDSSSITCMARNLLARENKQLHTFSAVFNKVRECDERKYINTVLRENSIKSNFIAADSFGPFVDIDEILRVLDEPFLHSNLYITWLSYKAAEAQGVKVILDGYDGDSTVSHGLGLFTELAVNKRWARLILENIAYARRTDQNWRKSAWSWIWNCGLDPWISKNQFAKKARKIVLRGKRKVGLKDSPPQAENLTNIVELNPDFARRISLKSPKKNKALIPLTERETHLQNLNNNACSLSLEILDCISQVFSLEVRFPFWDKRLVEFCLSLPPDQKIKSGWTRMVMRRAMADVLPPEIQWRAGKSDLGPSFRYGLLKFGQKMMDDVIVNNPEMIVDYVDIKPIREAHQRFLKSQASQKDVLGIQRCIFLALWLQKVV